MLRIEDVQFLTQTRPSELKQSLYACIGERVTAVITLYSETVTVTNEDLQIVIKPPLTEVRITTDIAQIIKIEDSEFVAKLSKGVEFGIFSDVEIGVFTVDEILSENLIRVNESLAAFGDNQRYGGEHTQGYAVNGAALKYLFIKFGVTNGGYLSPTTGEEQSASITVSDLIADESYSDVPLELLGGKEWQADSVTFFGDGDGEGTEQRVIIEHDFIVTPLFLATELDDLLAGIIPESFGKPKYQAEINYSESAEIANIIEVPETGKIGYFNQRFDGANPNYKVNSLVLTRVSDSQTVDALEYDTEIEVVATIERKTGNINTSDTYVVAGINYLPQDESLYKENGRTLIENFAYDSMVARVNVSPVLGTDNITVLEVDNTPSTNTMTVRFRVELTTESKEIVRQEAEAWYSIWLIIEDTSLVYPVSDKCSLLLQTEKFYEKLVDIDLFDNDTVFIEHPYESTFFGQETLEMFPVDDVVANSYITCDYTGKENDNIKINSVEQLLALTHATEADIILERNFINCENYPLVGSLPAIQDIDYVQDRPFQIPSGEIRKTIAFGRDYTNDSGLVKAFGLSYPFMNRWEYWNKLEGVNNIPSSLFDASKDFKGINHFWNRLINVSGWDLVYRTRFTIEQNGVLFQQEFEDELTSTNFNSNTDWSNCTIKSFDSVSNVEITASGTKYLDSDKFTKIVCSFEKTTGDLPTSDGYTIVMWIERFENGSIADIQRISSKYSGGDTNILKSTDGSGKVVINKTGAVYTGTCFVDHSKIPDNTSKMTIYARIYETSTEAFNVRITNDGKVRQLLDQKVRIIL